MTPLIWIIVTGLGMSLAAFVGVFTLFLSDKALKKILLPFVALAAGSMLGGAFFHMIPEAIEELHDVRLAFVYVVLGFSLFFVLEQFLDWHHCHKTKSEHSHGVSKMVLIADGLHNLLGGLAVGGAFVVDVKLGLLTWFVALAHEIPQELGDFGVLVHDGWAPKKALLYNFCSALTFPLGGVLAYLGSSVFDVRFLIPLAAGNFIYIATVDLVPEIKSYRSFKINLIHFVSFTSGLVLLYFCSTWMHVHPNHH